MIPKPKRIKNKQAIEDCRKTYCEYCLKGGPVHVHHVKTRGSHGDDIPENPISLGEWCGCHAKAHNAQISKAEL